MESDLDILFLLNGLPNMYSSILLVLHTVQCDSFQTLLYKLFFHLFMAVLYGDRELVS